MGQAALGGRYGVVGVESAASGLGHGLALHLAVLQLPLVILLAQARTDKWDDRGLVGEDLDHVGPPLDLLC
jgi:hypothetical protein